MACCLAVGSWGSVDASSGSEWGAGAVQGEVYMKGDNEIELKWGKCSLQMHVHIHGSIKLQ